ncbi:hypothetical protein ACFL46_03540 [Candidatus Neomarinimicrobiota bacterium]
MNLNNTLKLKVLLTISLIFVSIFNVRCSSSYGPRGMMGGYFDTQLSEATYEVSFIGNQHTSIDKVNSSLIYRCAELTLEKGYEYFVILDESVDTSKVFIRSIPDDVKMSVSSQSGMNKVVVVPNLDNPPESNKFSASCSIKMYSRENLDFEQKFFFAPQIMKAFESEVLN